MKVPMSRRRLTLGCLVLLLLFSASYLVATGQGRRWWLEFRRLGPKIEYPRNLDLGEHAVGDQAVVRFVISNRGGERLVLDNIRTNCSCTGMERESGGQY
jgi:hypothetical protein